MNKTNVLFVTASTTGGGAERMLFNIIRSLDDTHEACLFITSEEKIPQQYKDDVYAVNADKKHAICAFRQLTKEIKRFKPQYVFTTSSNVGYMLILAKKLIRADFKIYIRCAVTPSEIYQRDIKSRLLNVVIRLSYNSADAIIAQTDFMRDDLIKSYKINPNKVRTIRNIIDYRFILSNSDKFIPVELHPNNYNIVAAGALYSVKGFDLLIEAIAPIVKSNPLLRLYILGDERYEEGYKNFLDETIKKYNLEQHVHLLGHRSNPYPYFRAADLFVMSSRKEGFPNVVLEALGLGTPVVATDCVDFGGVIEDGVNGYVVKKEDIDSLRNGIALAITTDFCMSKNQLTNYNYNLLFNQNT